MINNKFKYIQKFKLSMIDNIHNDNELSDSDYFVNGLIMHWSHHILI